MLQLPLEVTAVEAEMQRKRGYYKTQRGYFMIPPLLSVSVQFQYKQVILLFMSSQQFTLWAENADRCSMC